MPQFTLYGARGSSNTDRVRLTLADAGFTDYDTVLLNLATGEQKSRDHVQRHPWGKVPAVAFPDSDFVLYESRAICKFLAHKYNFPLLPAATDLPATALFDQAQSVEMQYFAEPAGRINFETVAKRFMGLPADEAVVAASLKAVLAYFDVAETLLQKQEYMAGTTFTLVDIYYIPLVTRLFAAGYGDHVMADRPAVRAWWGRVTSRPGIQALLETDKKAAAAAAAKK
ncbi:glutathione S-transferase [Sporothrix schenckii 1099-18]|uniref:glutathione transferase n=2 Tax=Sporothrix schenckii TaxID=29908 RepID=U7PRB2_SPOS1|nr:glutathione S-transferase [Sporothrix schenckii 1099-18]ERS98132.1 hypothetical protein HMPREF1624_04912 [Sporothrix schenckii ATCC 58251]KJR89774.1 glutathione S-transferase [Sporothrix schenckii 1099-18]